MICLETPASIWADDAVDVFAEVVPDTDQYYLVKRQQLWDHYRYYGIGHCDRSYWLQNIKDRYSQIKETYDLKFTAWTDWLQARSQEDTIDFGDFQSVSKIERSDLPDTPVTAGSYLSEETRTTYSTTSGQSPEQVRRYMDAISNLSDDFAREFSRYFSPFA